MTRPRAIAYLMASRKAAEDEIRGLPVRIAEQHLGRTALIDRILFDVRANRVHRFELAGPPAVEIFITW